MEDLPYSGDLIPRTWQRGCDSSCLDLHGSSRTHGDWGSPVALGDPPTERRSLVKDNLTDESICGGSDSK